MNINEMSEQQLIDYINNADKQFRDHPRFCVTAI